MRDRELRLHYHPVAVEYDVDIDSSRAPVNFSCPVKIIFDYMNLIQELKRIDIGIKTYACIEEIRLVLKTYGLSLIDRCELQFSHARDRP